MRTLKIAVSLLGLMIGLSIFGSTALGKKEYTTKEKKACSYCHVKTGAKELNDVGKCYQKNDHSLKGCEEKPAEEKKS